MTDAVVSLEDVRFRYPGGEFELELEELRISAGEVVACIGPSGSGKSTLLHLMSGILLAGDGRVRFDDVEWSSIGEAERRRRRISRIGLVFQEFELLEHLSVRENVLLPYFVDPDLVPGNAERERVAELARAAGLESLLDRRPRELSQGERQRVATCRALVTRAPLILGDEPTGNLDPETSRRVVDLLLSDVRARAATLVVVTHDHSLLDAFDRVIDLPRIVRHSNRGAST